MIARIARVATCARRGVPGDLAASNTCSNGAGLMSAISLNRLVEWITTMSWRALPELEPIDATLVRRDETGSENAWMREREAVGALLQRLPPQNEAKQAIDSISQQAFIKAFKASSHHDFAAQVSDDLRLIAEAAAVGYESDTINALWNAYAAGQFPESVT